MKHILIIILLFASSSLRAEFPELKPYAGVDYLVMDATFWGRQVTMQSARIKLGSELNKYSALEGHFGTGLSTDEDEEGRTWTSEMFWGLYLRGILPLHERVKVYGIFGITSIENEVSEEWGTNHYNSSGYSYGLGVEVFPMEQLSISLECMSLIDELNVTSSRDEGEAVFTSVAAGLKYYF